MIRKNKFKYLSSLMNLLGFKNNLNLKIDLINCILNQSQSKIIYLSLSTKCVYAMKIFIYLYIKKILFVFKFNLNEKLLVITIFKFL